MVQRKLQVISKELRRPFEVVILQEIPLLSVSPFPKVTHPTCGSSQARRIYWQAALQLPSGFTRWWERIYLPQISSKVVSMVPVSRPHSYYCPLRHLWLWSRSCPLPCHRARYPPPHRICSTLYDSNTCSSILYPQWTAEGKRLRLPRATSNGIYGTLRQSSAIRQSAADQEVTADRHVWTYKQCGWIHLTASASSIYFRP